MSYYTDVLEFQRTFWPEYVAERPTLCHLHAVAASYRHVLEEVAEIGAALDDGDVVAAADGIADAIYVLCGLAARLGVPLDEVWAEVHAANMRKVRGPGPRGDIDVVKPADWQPPDVAGVVRRHLVTTE